VLTTEEDGVGRSRGEDLGYGVLSVVQSPVGAVWQLVIPAARREDRKRLSIDRGGFIYVIRCRQSVLQL